MQPRQPDPGCFGDAEGQSSRNGTQGFRRSKPCTSALNPSALMRLDRVTSDSSLPCSEGKNRPLSSRNCRPSLRISAARGDRGPHRPCPSSCGLTRPSRPSSEGPFPPILRHARHQSVRRSGQGTPAPVLWKPMRQTGHLDECRHGKVALAQGERVASGSCDGPVGDRWSSRISQTDQIGGSEARFAASAARDDALSPVPGAIGVDLERESTTVRVFAGAPAGFCRHHRQGAGGFASSGFQVSRFPVPCLLPHQKLEGRGFRRNVSELAVLQVLVNDIELLGTG